MIMLSKDEFNGVMRKNLTCLMIAPLNFTHVRCTHDEETQSYIIEGIPHGSDTAVVYKFIYHIRRDTTFIDEIWDDRYNVIIDWKEWLEQYDLCNRESDIPYKVLHTLAFAMNNREMVVHNSRNHQNPKEEKVMPKIKAPGMKPKQKKKVYPNIFERPGVNAGIKDIQIHHKNGKTTTTVVWTDMDAKGKNIITTVSCPTRCATHEVGIAMCIAKRYFDGRNEFKRVAEKAMVLNSKRVQQASHRAVLKAKKKGEIDDSQ